MATEDEAREAADGTEVQVEAVDLRTVHLQAHSEVKLPSVMEIKNVGEIIHSIEGTLTIPEDQVLVEAPSEVELPPEHSLNGEASSLNGHMDKKEKISNQSNGFKKEEVTYGLSHGESTPEDEELRDDQQDSQGVTMDDDLGQEDTLKTESCMEQTDNGQQDQIQEPEKANEDTQPARIAENADVEEVEAPIGLQTPVETHLNDSGAVPGTTDENTETQELPTADSVVYREHQESFPEDTSIAEPTEEVVKVEDQQTQQADTTDAEVVQEEMLKCEETDVPKSETHEETMNAQEMLNKESAEELDDPMNEKIEETAHQSNMAAPKETTLEHDDTTMASPVNIQAQNQEPSEEIERAEAVDTEVEIQQSSVAFEDATPEDQPNLSVTMDSDSVQEDTQKAIEQKDDGQQDQDIEPEKATEDTQAASMADTPDVEVVDEAPSVVQNPMELNLDNCDAAPDTIDGNIETDEPAKADGVVHLEPKESSPEDESIAEPTEEVVNVEDQQGQQGDTMDADVLQEEVPKSEHADEPATDAHEVLNQESTEETDDPVNEKTEETAHQNNMVAPEETTPEHDTTTRAPPANIQEQNEESLEETKDAEVTTENTRAASMSNSAYVEVVAEAPSGVQTHVEINLDNSDAIPDTTDGNTETDESAKTEGATETSEPQVTETEELKDIEATEAQEITEHGHITISKELSEADGSTTDEPDNDDIQQTLGQDWVEVKETVSTSEDMVEDNVTAEEPTCDSQEVDNAESTEEAKKNIADNIAGASEVAIVDEAVEEQNVLQTEDISETHMRELDPEETKNTEPVESEEASDRRNAVLFNDLAQEDTLVSEMQKESATETTETEAALQESNGCVSEEPLPEDHTTESETNCDTQEVSITESLEVIDGDKDIITGGISGQSNMVSPGESAQENDVPEREPTVDIQPAQEPEPEEIKNTELVEVKETSHEMNTTVFQTPVEQDNPATIEMHESARELSNIEATEEGAPNQSDADQSEEQAPEEITSEPQVLEQESVEEMTETEAIGPPNISQDNITSTTGKSVPEDIATEGNIATEPDVDHRQLQDQEVNDNEAMEAEEVVPQSNIAIPDDATEEMSELRSDPDSCVQLLSRECENNQLVKAEETSGQVNTVTIEETPIEDSAVSEIDPPVDIKHEHEQEPVEEIKGIDANEAGEEFHTSPVDTTEKPASEDTIASVEPTFDIKQENELEETKEINGIEAINDGEQTKNATLDDPSPTDNETTPDGHPEELNEETTENEIDNVMLVTGIKDEIQTSVEQKDDPCLGEIVLTTQRSEEVTDEDAVQSPGDDILETSNNIDHVKEEKKDGCEMSSAQNEETIIHIQDRDISGELLTKRGTEEASFESDPQGEQDATKKDDTTEGSEQTSDLNRHPDDVALQLQTCEADALSIEEQNEVVQKVDLDQQQKEDDEIESQKEELQADEQKHEGKGDSFTMEPPVEPKDIESGNTDRREDTDACEAEQTETVIKHGEAPHVSEESTPSSMDMHVDNVNGTDEGTEEDADAKNDNKDEKESAEKDNIVAKDSTDEHDGTTDEITNEELEPGLASSGQEASDLASSKDDIIENGPATITQNVESGEHTEDKECTGKVNGDVQTIQASEREMTDEINENKEIRNEDNAIHHDESHTKSEEEEAPQLHSNEPCSMDAKIDDTTITLGEEIIDGNASIEPTEIEDIGENKGLESTSEPFVESSIQNNVEQDLSSYHKVEDEKLSMTEQNDVDVEAMPKKADESALDINQTKKCQEEINKDDVEQLEIEENAFHNIYETVSHEKTETSTIEAITINDNITNKASGADGGPCDGSIETFNDTGKNLDVSSVTTASKEESVNENIEDHKLALPAHTVQDGTTPEQVLCLDKTEREMPPSEKVLPTEPEEHQISDESNEKELQDENQIPNEQNEEDMQDAEIGDTQKDVEQDLPVSHFLMNLILGKKNSDANESSESEPETKQGETIEDDSCVIIPKEQESFGSLPTKDKVDDSLTLEQEKHDVKFSEETQEMVKKEIDDFNLDTERSIHTDEEFNKNTCDLEIPAYQGNPQDKISSELLSEEAASISTKMESRDIEISNLELDDKAVDTVCQENTEASTKIENGNLDLTNTKASEEDTLGEGQAGIQHESLSEDKNANAVSEQMLLLTDSDMIDAKDLSCDAEAVQKLACAKEDEPTESSIIEATSTPDIQLEREEAKAKEGEQHASTATGEVSQEDVESSNNNLQKSTSSEVTSDEQAPEIIEPVSDTEKILDHEKEISEGLTCMDEKENSNFSTKGVENFQIAVETQANSPNMQTNQDKKDEVANSKTSMELEKLGESDFQENQETGTEQNFHKVTDEVDQQLLVEKETMIKEHVVLGTVESHEQTMSIKSNEEKELFDSKVPERDLNVVSTREAFEAEENFVDVTKPEFSTDEEHSPKADAEEKPYDEKIKEVEETKNFTDGATMKTKAPGATQKAHKKHNLLSGVGSKVKHQLAKVKKAIVGKPGNTKPESPKS